MRTTAEIRTGLLLVGGIISAAGGTVGVAYFAVDRWVYNYIFQNCVCQYD